MPSVRHSATKPPSASWVTSKTISLIALGYSIACDDASNRRAGLSCKPRLAVSNPRLLIGWETHAVNGRPAMPVVRQKNPGHQWKSPLLPHPRHRDRQPLEIAFLQVTQKSQGREDLAQRSPSSVAALAPRTALGGEENARAVDHLGESLAGHNLLSYALPESHGERNRKLLHMCPSIRD
jgi:hypothetical protein